MLTAAVVHEKAGNGFIHTVCSDFMPLKKNNKKKNNYCACFHFECTVFSMSWKRFVATF